MRQLHFGMSIRKVLCSERITVEIWCKEHDKWGEKIFWISTEVVFLAVR